jgi:hypothetical protein
VQNSCDLIADQKLQAKKTPLGERGIRVIVVVANSVSVSAYGLWWIIVILVTDLIIIIVVYSFSCFVRYLLASMSVNQISNCPASQKPFCAHVYISKSCANLALLV